MADVKEEPAKGVGSHERDDTVTNGAAAEVKEEVKSEGAKTEIPAEDAKAGGDAQEEDSKHDGVTTSARERSDHKNSRGRGGGMHRYNKQINSRFDEQPESDDADEIRRQVEFYFSDSNLPIDSYLLSLTGGHRNQPVELKVIHNFKRMRHFQPYSAVRDAVKASTFLNLDDHDEITRRVPLSDKFTDDADENRNKVHNSSMSRSIYAKGFGNESKSTHLDIEAFFAPYGPLNSVRLRRKEDGAFKGSVFVEFETDELQQQFLDLEIKPQWNDKDLDIMSKQKYVDVKHQGIIDGEVRPRSPGSRPYYENKSRDGDRRYNDRHRGDRDRGSRDKYDKDDWKSRRDRDQRRDGRDRRDGGGRGGRGGRGGKGFGRGGRDRRDRRDDSEERYSKRRYSDSGEDADERKPVQSKKRALDDAEDGQGEAKKLKEEVQDAKNEAGDS